jgi:Na+-transporting methylmalonyl-CoA/oxaloacetate decarboxylase gamma subunit
MLQEALQLMGAGIGVVFIALALFFVVMTVLMKIFPPKKPDEKPDKK